MKALRTHYFHASHKAYRSSDIESDISRSSLHRIWEKNHSQKKSTNRMIWGMARGPPLSATPARAADDVLVWYATGGGAGCIHKPFFRRV